MADSPKYNEYCDFSCPRADFPKDTGLDGSGSCRTFSAVWCRELERYVTKNAPCMRLDFRPPPTLNGHMKQGTCKGEHEGHICVLASRGAFGEIKKLAAKPRYICFNCGRVAECDANLCNPMPIDG